MTTASNLAETLLTQLGEDFTVPSVDLDDAEYSLPDQTGNPLYGTIADLDIEELTEGAVGGAGAFDKIMSSHRAHLEEQRDQDLISGADYTKAYIELTGMAMQSALSFLLQGRESYWNLLTAQQMARKAEIETRLAAVQLATAKQQLAAMTYQAQTYKAQHALTTMQLAESDAKYELAVLQKELVQEQIEVQRAQTLDTRTDGAAVAGMLGKQKDLYSEQISSYKKDAQQKFLRSMLDTWITQKSIDEGLTAPTALSNTEISEVVNSVRAANDLGS